MEKRVVEYRVSSESEDKQSHLVLFINQEEGPSRLIFASRDFGNDNKLHFNHTLFLF